MKNIIRDTILKGKGKILNVYFTAGHPNLDDTEEIIGGLEKAGADLIELGMPYSDPLADGLTIQKSSEQALKNGMTLNTLFKQISAARQKYSIPIILMGYYNQLLQYGVEKFLKRASKCGVNGMIIPDLPMSIYEKDYQSIFNKYGLSISFLISPMTSDERIRQADRLSSAFIYVVSQSSITGKSDDITESQRKYFEKIRSMHLKSPQLIGFGIYDNRSFETACKYSHGAIVGSAFIRALNGDGSIEQNIQSFITRLRT